MSDQVLRGAENFLRVPDGTVAMVTAVAEDGQCIKGSPRQAPWPSATRSIFTCKILACAQRGGRRGQRGAS